MYPYNLGWHIKTQQLCRIPRYCIPVGTVKIIRYRRIDNGYISQKWTHPYAFPDGELNNKYWSIARAQDIEYALQREKQNK